MLLQQRLDAGFVAEKQESHAGMALEGDGGARHDDGRACVSPHGVKRYGSRCCHDPLSAAVSVTCPAASAEPTRCQPRSPPKTLDHSRLQPPYNQILGRLQPRNCTPAWVKLAAAQSVFRLEIGKHGKGICGLVVGSVRGGRLLQIEGGTWLARKWINGRRQALEDDATDRDLARHDRLPLRLLVDGKLALLGLRHPLLW